MLRAAEPSEQQRLTRRVAERAMGASLLLRLCAKALLLPLCAIPSLMLAGCAPTTTQADRAQFLGAPAMERTLAASGLKSANGDNAWPSDAWWRNFHSAELTRVVDKALADNQNLKKAGDTLRVAEASVRIASAKLSPAVQSDYWMRQSRNPNHGVVASYNSSQGGLEKTAGFLTPFVVTWELDFWDKNRAGMDAAIGEAEAREAEFQQTRLLLTTGVSRAYLRGYALARQLEIAGELIKLRYELLQLAETRFQTGLDTMDGVQIARAHYESAIRREATVRAALAIQQDAIARMMGEGPDAARNLFTGKQATPSAPALPRHLPVELLAHRPDLAAALRRAEASAEKIHVAKTLLLPSIDLSIASGLEGSTTTSTIGKLGGYLFTPGATGYSVVPGFHLPIFQGGRLSGNLAGQRAEYDMAVESYNETLLASAQQVADSLANLKRAMTEYQAQGRLVAASSEQVALARTRLRDGLRDRREVEQEQIELLEARYVEHTLNGDRMVASVDLYQSLGGGYTNTADLAKPKPAPENDPITPAVDTITSMTGG